MRGGTTVFRQWLASPTPALDIGEVFHGWIDRPHNFWGYLHQLAVDDAKFRHPSSWEEAWKRFIEAKHIETSASILIFDLKVGYLNYVLNYDGLSYKAFCLDAGTKIIFLERRNVAQLVLSRYAALRSNRWFELSRSPAPELLAKFRRVRDIDDLTAAAVPALVVDPQEMARDIEAALMQNREVLRLFADRIAAKVVYEELFDECGAFRGEVLREIAGLMNLPEAAFHPRPILEKQRSGPMLAEVANAEDVLRFFRQTEHWWMFGEQ